MDLHGISLESFSPESPHVQDFFWNILEEAERSADFKIEDGRVLVEALPQNNNGIIIFLTRPGGQTVPFPEKRAVRLRYRVKPTARPKTNDAFLAYRFESFDDLCAFCGGWRYAGERSNLYHLDEAYILTLSFDKISFDKAYTEAQILEFGVPAPSLSAPYLEEHAQKICDGDAIFRIAGYFKN